MTDLAAYANAGGPLTTLFDTWGNPTHILADHDTYALYPVSWCTKCGGDRPHHGPYCMSCGTPSDGIVP